MTDKKTVAVLATVSLEVEEDWIELLTQYPDIFSTGYCGYWMYGMEHDNTLGWLVYEHDERLSIPQVQALDDYKTIVSDWRAGKPLPEKWYRLDRDAAILAYQKGAEKYGADWYDRVGDAITYDVAIQLALLGKVVYG